MTAIITSLVQRQKTAKTTQCEICGAMANYFYFGIKSCQACKVFFRRNAQRGQNGSTCPYSGQCEINIHARHTCASCRLKKCFEKGMKIEMIRAPLTKKEKKQSSNTSVPSKQIEQIRVTNLLNKDSSLLTENQWTLLTNLIHSYEEKNALQSCSNMSNQQTIVTKSVADEIIQLFYKTAGDSLQRNQDITRLSMNDRSILLHRASTNLTCLGAFFIYHYSELIGCNSYWIYVNNTYGQLIKELNQRATQYTNCDYVLCKLSLCLFIFCTYSTVSYSNVSFEYENPRDLFNIENKYVEIIWQYLLFNYGLKQSIQKYLEIIQWFLAATELLSCVYDIPEHVNDIGRLVEDIELNMILDDTDNDV